MQLYRKGPNPDLTVVVRGWTKPTEKFADTPLIEDGAFFAGEKLWLRTTHIVRLVRIAREIG